MATESTSLRMTFSLSNGKTKLVSLADPRDDVSAADASSFMDNAVTMNAMIVGGARLVDKKSAIVRSISEEVLF